MFSAFHRHWRTILCRKVIRRSCKGLLIRLLRHLSRINFEEGLASLRADDLRRGMEHLDLARQLVRSSPLRELIDAEFARIGSSSTSDMPLKAVSVGCSSSCCGTAATSTVASPELAGAFDEETRFDLVLTAYPFDLRPRYLEFSTLMRQAILLAHEERGR